MNLPSDPIILLSFINLKLRDYYPTLDALCEDLDIDPVSLIHTLEEIDYHYDPVSNRFV